MYFESIITPIYSVKKKYNNTYFESIGHILNIYRILFAQNYYYKYNFYIELKLIIYLNHSLILNIQQLHFFFFLD